MRASVLVVEDNPITRKLVSLTLRAEGLEVIDVGSGAEALTAFERHAIDLVLSDLSLSDMDGFELLARLRSLFGPRLPPVLAFTGLDDAERVLSAGFSDLLLKPIEPSRLVVYVNTYLDRVRRIELNPGLVPTPIDVSAENLETTTAQSRVWRSLSKLFDNLADLTAGAASFSEVVRSALASFLDFSGFPSGAAYLPNQNGQLGLTAQFGFCAPETERLPDFGGYMATLDHVMRVAEPLALEASNGRGIRLLLEQLGAESLLITPILYAREPMGVFVAASPNERVPADWIELVRLVAPPVGQSLQLANAVCRLAASEQRFRRIAESNRDGIVVADSTQQITYANESAGRVLGSEPTALIGQPVAQVMPFVADGAYAGTIRLPDGRDLPLEVSAQWFQEPAGDANGVYVLRDLSERLRIDELSWLANHDPLTGLVNRRRFEEELALRLAESRRYGTGGALLALDLDQFKPINDTHGHAAGDLVLRAVADVLRSTTRVCDLSARIGGDEFVVLLSHTNPSGASACAQKLVEYVSNMSTDWNGASLQVAVSIGIALFPMHGETPKEVLASADHALYAAKQAGRRRVCCFTPSTLSVPPVSGSRFDSGFVPTSSVSGIAPAQGREHEVRSNAELGFLSEQGRDGLTQRWLRR